MTSNIKKRGQTILLIIGGLVVIYFVLLHGLSLRKEANRMTSEYHLEENIKNDIKIGVSDKENIDDIISFSSDFTCKQLSFNRRNDLKNGKANCVGYAQYTSEVLNHVFNLKGHSYKARPVVGKVYLYGVNLHPILLSILPKSQSSFFSDHDFVEIVLDHGTVMYIDSSLQDLTGKMISSEQKISAYAD